MSVSHIPVYCILPHKYDIFRITMKVNSLSYKYICLKYIYLFNKCCSVSHICTHKYIHANSHLYTNPLIH